MSNNEENGELESEIKNAVKTTEKKVIEIKHSGIVDAKEFEKIKDERDTLKSQLGLIAEKSFRDEKEAVVSQYPEEKQDEISDLIGEDPDVLEQIKTDLKLHGSPIKQRPTGKAVLRQTGDVPEVVQGQKDDYQEFIDSLYKKARLSANPEERNNAERQIEQLFESYEKGMQENPDKPFETHTTQCLKCGAILSGRDAKLYSARRINCPVCGYSGGTRGIRNPQNLSW